MDYSNLAVVIGPNILHNHKQGNSDSNTQLAIEAEETPLAVEVVKGLMQNHKPLFIVRTSSAFSYSYRILRSVKMRNGHLYSNFTT